MTLGDRFRSLRRDLGLSQEAIGAQGFVSAPGWIKIENEQRQPSEKLIEKLVRWLVSDRYIKAGASAGLREELLTLKYLGSRSPFVRNIAEAHAKTLPTGAMLLAETPEGYRAKKRRRKRTPKRPKS